MYLFAVLDFMNYTCSVCHACFISLLLTVGGYRECVLDEVLTPDQDVHVSFRRIGRAVFLATRGNQSPVWRHCLKHYLILGVFYRTVSLFVAQDTITQPIRFPFMYHFQSHHFSCRYCSWHNRALYFCNSFAAPLIDRMTTCMHTTMYLTKLHFVM